MSDLIILTKINKSFSKKKIKVLKNISYKFKKVDLPDPDGPINE